MELLDKYFGSVSFPTHPVPTRQSPLSTKPWDPSSLCLEDLGEVKLEQ